MPGLCISLLAEGFGLPVLEAMHCGKPIITSAEAALPEVGGGLTTLIHHFEPGYVRSKIEESMSFLYPGPGQERRKSRTV
ncbi:MAG: glycosyltransferase [Owenweeksia sp.]|nr:glycosyltransferase [Owenweeksia sp.]